MSKDRKGPPEWVYAISNPVVTAVLRSPLHGLLSKMLMLLTFRGRKTGKPYTIPVGYQRRENELIIYSHHDWWKNLRGGKPVSVLLQGRRRAGLATPQRDEEVVLQYVRDFVERNGVQNLRRLGISLSDAEREASMPSDEELRRAIRGTVIIGVELDEGEESR